MERKGASYSIKAKRPAQDPSEHEQVTQATYRIGPRGPTRGALSLEDRGGYDPESFEEESRWEAQRDYDRYERD
jgi:hypothetical protein